MIFIKVFQAGLPVKQTQEKESSRRGKGMWEEVEAEKKVEEKEEEEDEKEEDDQAEKLSSGAV